MYKRGWGFFLPQAAEVWLLIAQHWPQRQWPRKILYQPPAARGMKRNTVKSRKQNHGWTVERLGRRGGKYRRGNGETQAWKTGQKTETAWSLKEALRRQGDKIAAPLHQSAVDGFLYLKKCFWRLQVWQCTCVCFLLGRLDLFERTCLHLSPTRSEQPQND